MATIDDWRKRLAKLEAQQLTAERQRVAAERELRDGNPARRTWLHPGPDGQRHLMQWTPQMGPWEVLAAKIDAAEDAAHGQPHHRADGSLAMLPQLMAEIEQCIQRAADDSGNAVNHVGAGGNPGSATG